MAAPDDSSYLLVNADSGDLQNSRRLIASPSVANFQFIDSGPGGNYTLTPSLNVAGLINLSSSGLVVYNSSTKSFTGRGLQSDSSIHIENANGVSGSPVFSVVDNTSVQQLTFQSNGVDVATRSKLNIVQGSNVTVTVADDGDDDRATMTISTNAAPANSSYIYGAASTGHSFNLGTLSSGLLKIGVASSIATPARAIPDTDYLAPNDNLLQLGALEPTEGDIIAYYDDAWNVIGAGEVGEVLKIGVTGIPAWAADATPSLSTFLTQTGDDLPENGINLGATDARLGIGLEEPTASLDILSTDTPNVLNGVTDTVSDGPGGITLTNYGGNNGKSTIVLRSARGSLDSDPVSENQILSGDIVAQITARGCDDLGEFGNDDAGAIKFIAAQNYTDGSRGTKVSFFTTLNGTDTPFEAGYFTNAGVLNATWGIISNAGLAVTSGATVLGATTTTTLSSSGLITASAGLTSTAGATTLGATTATTLTASGLITASNGLTSTAGATTLGATTSTTLTASGLITASSGLTSTAGATTLGATTATTLTASGLITASDDLYVADKLGVNDSTPTYPVDITVTTNIDSQGSMGLHVDGQPSSGQTSGIIVDYAGAGGATGSVLTLRQSRGTIALRTQTIDGDRLAAINARGFKNVVSGVDIFTGTVANIEFYAEEDFESDPGMGTNNTGASMRLRTTPIGSGTLATTVTVQGGSTDPKVGIGNTSPSSALDVHGSTNITNFGATSITAVSDPQTNLQGGIRIINYGGTSPQANVQLVGSSGTLADPRRIASGTLLGALRARGYWATNAGDAATMAVNDTASILFRATQNFTSTSVQGTQVEIATTPTGSATQAVSMTILGGAASMVGIGATPTHTLELYNDDAYKTVTNVWSIPSDARIKTDISDIDGALDIINALKPRKFRYTQAHVDAYAAKLENGRENPYRADKDIYGFIADEVEQVLPECVKVTDDTSGEHENIKILNMHEANVYLFKAVQELSAKVAALEAQLASA